MLDIENEVWLIDFDKCQIRQGSSWKNSNIARLKRSFEKEKRLHNIYWQLADWQILISAYNEAAIANVQAHSHCCLLAAIRYYSLARGDGHLFSDKQAL
jgi:hypothetical protein